jgi:hypothetical protein
MPAFTIPPTGSFTLWGVNQTSGDVVIKVQSAKAGELYVLCRFPAYAPQELAGGYYGAIVWGAAGADVVQIRCPDFQSAVDTGKRLTAAA